MSSIRQAKHFILVLTPNALDRCMKDDERKDWVHRVRHSIGVNQFICNNYLFNCYNLGSGRSIAEQMQHHSNIGYFSMAWNWNITRRYASGLLFQWSQVWVSVLFLWLERKNRFINFYKYYKIFSYNNKIED